MKRTTILTILLSSAFSFGQKIEMSDLSAAGSPVSLSVKVDSEDSGLFTTVLAHNNSMKGVLAIVATVEVTDPHGQVLSIIARQDYVFKYGVIGPGNDRGIAWTDSPLELPHPVGGVTAHPDANVTPHAEGVVSFVQFEDGSIWGDPRAAKGMIAQRPEKLAFLQHLVDVYNMGGEAAFAAALDEPKAGSPASIAGCLKVDADHDKIARIDLAGKRLAAAQEWHSAGIF
ncbi:MAG TPA: hypothetical protein VEV41_28625 [Terriglobales bacterium]|nr:hypothetical protein [Terriglobales bacterium]